MSDPYQAFGIHGQLHGLSFLNGRHAMTMMFINQHAMVADLHAVAQEAAQKLPIRDTPDQDVLLVRIGRRMARRDPADVGPASRGPFTRM